VLRCYITTNQTSLVHLLLFTPLYTPPFHLLLLVGLMRRINLLLLLALIHSIRPIRYLVNNLINPLRRITRMALLHQEPVVLRVAIMAMWRSIKRGSSLFFDMLLICPRYVIITPNIKVHNGHVVSFHHIQIVLFSALFFSLLLLHSDFYRRFSCSTLVVILFRSISLDFSLGMHLSPAQMK
jgi:hypothetical protein